MGGMLSASISSKHIERKGSKDVKAACIGMQGFRNEMEDEHSIVLDLHEKVPGLMFFGVYDGHGGTQASIYCKTAIPSAIAKLSRPLDDDSIKKAVVDADEVFGETEHRVQGTTCCFVLVLPTVREDGRKQYELTIANVGDSRAMLIRKDGTMIPLTSDHKPENLEERTRIINAGGSVSSNRVDGNLAVSRALGDFAYKTEMHLEPLEQKVIPLPDITHQVAEEGDLLFVCCDGIYEHQTNEQVGKFLHTRYAEALKHGDKGFDLVPMLADLMDHSVDVGSKDNHTGILVQFADGSSYETKDNGCDFIPGNYHAHAHDSDWKQAYLKDARRTGMSDKEIESLVIKWEKENNQPTEISQIQEDMNQMSGVNSLPLELRQILWQAVASQQMAEDDEPVATVPRHKPKKGGKK